MTAPILALYPATTAVSPTGILQVPEVDSQTGDENYLLTRIDYTMDEKNSFFVRYVHDGASTILPFLGSPLPPRWPEQGITGNHFATVEWRRLISPNLVNLARFSFTRTKEADNQVNLGSSARAQFLYRAPKRRSQRHGPFLARHQHFRSAVAKCKTNSPWPTT